jgi:ABC-2 type transport system ATP-binding protein
MEDIRRLADYLIFINRGQMVGEFEKDKLAQQYKRFWLAEDLVAAAIPGEIEKKGLRTVTTNLPMEAEVYFQKEDIKCHAREFLKA